MKRKQRGEKKHKEQAKKGRRHRPDDSDEGLASTTSSSSESSEDSSTNSESCSDGLSDDDRAMVQRARQGKKRDRKNRKLKCKWPSSMLDGVFEEDEIAFKDLSMAQFLYGKLCIWDRLKIKKDEIKARQYLLKKVVKIQAKTGL